MLLDTYLGSHGFQENKTMIRLANFTLRSVRTPRWNLGSLLHVVEENAISSIVFHEASTSLDELDEIQKLLVGGMLREPFHAASDFGSMGDLLQRFTKEYLEEKFQEGLSMVAKQDQRIVGACLGCTLDNLDDSEAFPKTAAAAAYKSLRSQFCNTIRQTCAAKENVLFKNMAVLTTYQRSGLFRKFMTEWFDLVQSKGFRTVSAMSLTDHNSKKAEAANFEVVERISYDKFVFNDMKPFKSVASQLGGATLFIKIL